jgi:hypothetical protein
MAQFDILPALKGYKRGFLIAKEQVCIATTYWFLLLTALQRRSLHRLAPESPRVVFTFYHYSRLHTYRLVFAGSDFEAFTFLSCRH